LWTLGIFYDNLAYFSRFGMFYQEKSGNPGIERKCSKVFESFWLAQKVSGGYLQQPSQLAFCPAWLVSE
jgi:hypothetical protein